MKPAKKKQPQDSRRPRSWLEASTPFVLLGLMLTPSVGTSDPPPSVEFCAQVPAA
ncbi:hypothetical protein ACFQ8E_11770 [Isoptericola sp. NPDC056573]|uniref:hypothetical protein n=1 Tax=Isoptericola sp. NPDC056573 TaxID=3345868 RepID=UPI0036B32FB7